MAGLLDLGESTMTTWHTSWLAWVMQLKHFIFLAFQKGQILILFALSTFLFHFPLAEDKSCALL
jgi:hypothetical protein